MPKRKASSPRRSIEMGHPFPRSQVYRGNRLKEQVHDIKSGSRGLIAHWVKLNFVRENLGKPRLPKGGKRIWGKMRRAYVERGSKMTNGSLVRVGHIPRQRVNGNESAVPTVNVPFQPGKFFDYMQTVHGKKTVRVGKQKGGYRNPANESAYRRAHAQSVFNFGVNCILEVGNDGHGNPTHILIMKRPPTVPIEANVHDFPAGLVREMKPGASALTAVNARIAKETGIPVEKLRVVGPGFKPTNEEVFFTLQRLDRLANYNPVVIQRALVDEHEAARHVQANIDASRAKKDAFAPTGFVLLPRNPEAIAQFARTHGLFMPEVLRLYAQELNKHLPH